LSRFISSDPLNDGSQPIDPYSYVRANPLRNIDPTGKKGIAIGAQGSFAIPTPVAYTGEFGAGLYFYDGPDGWGVSAYTTSGEGAGIGIGFGGSAVLTSVASADRGIFFGESYDVGVNTPAVGASALVSTDPAAETFHGVYGHSVGVGPSIGGDVHVTKTYTKEWTLRPDALDRVIAGDNPFENLGRETLPSAQSGVAKVFRAAKPAVRQPRPKEIPSFNLLHPALGKEALGLEGIGDFSRPNYDD